MNDTVKRALGTFTVACFMTSLQREEGPFLPDYVM